MNPRIRIAELLCKFDHFWPNLPTPKRSIFLPVSVFGYGQIPRAPSQCKVEKPSNFWVLIFVALWGGKGKICDAVHIQTPTPAILFDLFLKGFLNISDFQKFRIFDENEILIRGFNGAHRYAALNLTMYLFPVFILTSLHAISTASLPDNAYLNLSQPCGASNCCKNSLFSTKCLFRHVEEYQFQFVYFRWRIKKWNRFQPVLEKDEKTEKRIEE